MTNIYFEELMAEFHCHTIRNNAFGAAEGYPYSADLISVKEKTAVTVRFLLDTDPTSALSFLKENPKEYIRWQLEENTLIGAITAPSDFYAKAAIQNLLSAATKTFIQTNLAPPHACPLCGLDGCDTYAFLGGDYRKTHAACLKTRLSLPDEDTIPAKTTRGFYVTGILGALTGAIVGGIPIWALALSNNRVYSAFYAFIPLLSALLYRLFRGKAQRNFAGIAVLLSSLLTAFALEQVWYWIVKSAEFGTHISFSQTIQIYFASNTVGSALYPMLLALGFLIAGCFPAAVILRRYSSQGKEQPRILRGATYVRESAMPIHPDDPKEETSPMQDSTSAGDDNPASASINKKKK